MTVTFAGMVPHLCISNGHRAARGSDGGGARRRLDRVDCLSCRPHLNSHRACLGDGSDGRRLSHGGCDCRTWQVHSRRRAGRYRRDGTDCLGTNECETVDLAGAGLSCR